jgi:hypothetical protein
VTSVKPATINTPFFNNTRNKLDVKPKGMPPVYEPSVVADCVLYAAENAVRDLFAGGAAKLMVTNQALSPKLVDVALARGGIEGQRTDEPASDSEGTLYAPRLGENRIRGDFSDSSRKSLYTWLETHPRATQLAVGGALAGAALLFARRRAD